MIHYRGKSEKTAVLWVTYWHDLALPDWGDFKALLAQIIWKQGTTVSDIISIDKGSLDGISIVNLLVNWYSLEQVSIEERSLTRSSSSSYTHMLASSEMLVPF